MRLSRQKRNQRSRLGARLLLFESLSNCPLPAIVVRIDSIDALRSLISPGFIEVQAGTASFERPDRAAAGGGDGTFQSWSSMASTLKRNNRVTWVQWEQPESNDPATPESTAWKMLTHSHLPDSFSNRRPG